MFEGKNRTRDKWLPELITKVGCTIRCLNKYLFGRLIEPFAYRKQLFPIASAVETGISRHVNGRSCDGPRPNTATHSVANFTARTCRGPIKGFYGGGEIVGFGLQRDNALDVFHLKIVGFRLVFGCELLHHRTLCKGNIVFISRENIAWIFGRGALNHGEKRRFFLFSVDNKRAAEYLMTAMFGVDLGKPEDFRVG